MADQCDSQTSMSCFCRHTYNLSMRFNYINSMMQNMNRAVGDAAEGDCVFRNLMLRVLADQRVDLVGRSSSDKTTLAKFLLRLSDVQEGCVLVDGKDVSACAQQNLRRQVAYVPQEALLFHRSIRENIAYGRPGATDDEVREE